MKFFAVGTRGLASVLLSFALVACGNGDKPKPARATPPKQIQHHIGKAGPSAFYPNPAYTPGAVRTTDVNVVCHTYTQSVRHITTRQRRRIFGLYRIAYPQPKGSYEFDHFVPLELGGSNEDANLWPEPANPTPGFHQKDVVENYLHRGVCVTHRLSLADAQKQIATDWYAVYLRIPS